MAVVAHALAPRVAEILCGHACSRSRVGGATELAIVRAAAAHAARRGAATATAAVKVAVTAAAIAAAMAAAMAAAKAWRVGGAPRAMRGAVDVGAEALGGAAEEVQGEEEEEEAALEALPAAGRGGGGAPPLEVALVATVEVGAESAVRGLAAGAGSGVVASGGDGASASGAALAMLSGVTSADARAAAAPTARAEMLRTITAAVRAGARRRRAALKSLEAAAGSFAQRAPWGPRGFAVSVLGSLARERGQAPPSSASPGARRSRRRRPSP